MPVVWRSFSARRRQFEQMPRSPADSTTHSFRGFSIHHRHIRMGCPNHGNGIDGHVGSCLERERGQQIMPRQPRLVNGVLLSTCSLRQPRTGCVHGACGGDGSCVCEEGWSGSSCEDYCPGLPACGGPQRGRCGVVSIAQNESARIVGLLAVWYMSSAFLSARFGRRCVCQSGFSGDGCDSYSCPPCLNGGSCLFSEDCVNGHHCAVTPFAQSTACDLCRMSTTAQCASALLLMA